MSDNERQQRTLLYRDEKSAGQRQIALSDRGTGDSLRCKNMRQGLF